MYTGVLALFCRSLRVDVRSRGAHLVRVMLLAAIYLSLTQIQMMSAFVSAPGLNFFSSILWLNVTFLTLIGIGAFSNAITEEKEEDSLGLLKMAGVDSLGLLLGKVGGRLIQAVAFLVVQFPFTLLSITMGGVGIGQIRAAYVSLAAYLLMLAGLGVFCSTVAQSNRSSSRLMIGFLLLYAFVPSTCAALITEMARSGQTSLFLPLMRPVSSSCILLQSNEIMATGYDAPLWNVQVVSNTFAGIVGFLLSWALFDVCTRNPSSEPSTRGLVTHKTSGFRWFNPGRTHSNPLAWKDFHFATGGIAGLLIRFASYSVVFVVIASWNGYWFPSVRLGQICTIYLAVSFALLPFDASLLISRSLQDEVRGQTISSLVMLPQSVPSIVYSKLGGALLGLIPGLACCALTFLGSDILEYLLTPSTWPQRSANWSQQWLGVFSAILYGGSMMLLLPHLTAVIALTVRWGATPLALGALYAVYMVEIMILMVVSIYVIGMRGGIAESSLFFLGIANIALCTGCHWETLRRFRGLAEK